MHDNGIRMNKGWSGNLDETEYSSVGTNKRRSRSLDETEYARDHRRNINRAHRSLQLYSLPSSSQSEVLSDLYQPTDHITIMTSYQTPTSFSYDAAGGLHEVREYNPQFAPKKRSVRTIWIRIGFSG